MMDFPVSKQFACRKAAVISDIHSNYYAFRTCVDDALSRGADGFIFLGDYVSDLADPIKTMDLVYEIQAQYPTVCLRGNRERYMLEQAAGSAAFSRGSKTGSLLYTFEQLRPRDLVFFRSLPVHDRIVFNGIPMEIAHAAGEDDRVYFEQGDDRIDAVFEQMTCIYLLTGHSHKQYSQSSHGKTILNPGSVGVPRGHGYLTQYALLEVKNDNVSWEFRQLPYDIEAAIHSQFSSGLVEHGNCWAVGILYDVITGKEYALPLLEQVTQRAAEEKSSIHNEQIWRMVASEMGMDFTEEKMLAFCRSRSKAW